MRVFKDGLNSAIRGSFFRNTAILASGTAVSQGLNVVAAPVLSRIYTPEMFGVFGLFSAVLGLFLVFASWRYEVAIVLPGDDEEALNLMILSCLLVIITAVLAGVLAGFGRSAAEVLGCSGLTPIIWWLPLSVLAGGFAQVLVYWSIRRNYFKRLSVYKAAGAVTSVITQIIPGVIKAGTGWLVAGQFLGQAVCSIGLWVNAWRSDKSLLRSAKLSEIKKMSRLYSDFPRYNLPQSALNAFSQCLPQFTMAYFFGPEVVGYYLVATRVLNVPSEIISQSVRQVFYQKASETHLKNGDTYSLFINSTLGLIAAGLIPAIILLLYSPAIFSALLGSGWQTAGLYAQWIVLWILFSLANPPAVTILQILRKQHLLLGYEILLFLSRLAVLITGGLYLDGTRCIALYSILGAVFNFCIILSVGVFLRQKDKKFYQCLPEGS